MIQGIDHRLIVPNSVFHVVKNIATGEEIKTPLKQIACDGFPADSDLSDRNEQSPIEKTIQNKECLDFDDYETPTYIGEEKDKNRKQYVSIEIHPCLSNCYKHTFPLPPMHPLNALMPYEINPLNPMNAATGLYYAFMHKGLQDYFLATVDINTAPDYENFDKPIKRIFGNGQ